jgi:hypothetical protein
MTRHKNLRDFIDHAFAVSTPLCRARFGPVVADMFVDERAAPQGFEHGLVKTDAPATASFAILTGDERARRPLVPERADRVHVLADSEFYAHWRPAPDAVLSVYDPATRRGVVWYPEAVAPPGSIGYPCVPLVHAALQGTEWCVAHTASVGRDGRQLLLTGPGKAGKSTAALACMRAGWDYAGDDLVLLNPARGLVEPMFASARLRNSGAAAFRALADGAFMVSDEEGQPRFELRLPLEPRGGKVAAILGIHRKGASSVEIGPGRLADYMGALLRDSNNRAPGYAASTTRKLLSIGGMAPLFAVDTGTDPAAIPIHLGAFLEKLP